MIFLILFIYYFYSIPSYYLILILLSNLNRGIFLISKTSSVLHHLIKSIFNNSLLDPITRQIFFFVAMIYRALKVGRYIDIENCE